MKKLQFLREWVIESLDKAYQRQASRYNLRRRNRTFRIGDLVLRRQHTLSSAAQNVAAKLAHRFQGPFKVGRVISPVIYELTRLDGSAAGKTHVQNLKPYHSPDAAP